jgi:hypothetical protein
VYHPDEGHSFANYGFPGIIGTITGYSSAGIGVSEKVLDHRKTLGEQASRFGYPSTWFMRDVLQFDTNMEDVVRRGFSIKRTSTFFFGAGFRESNTFFDSEYGANDWKIFTDQNFTAFENHPQMDNLLWITKHAQPDTRPCTHELIKAQYGKISPEWIIRDFTARHQSGDLHIAVYDFANDTIYLSGASVLDNKGNFLKAYERAFLKLEMQPMWSVEKPDAIE